MNRNSKKLIAVFLAIFMIFSSVGVYATEAAGTFSQQQELQFDWNIVNYEEFSMFEEAFEEFFLFETFEEMEEPAISENRRKYLELLESGYSNYQLRQRFAELFGDGYSGEYIFHNYRTIFDLKDGEMIDSAFLRVLSAYRVDLRFQDTGGIHHRAAGRASDDGRVRIFEGSEVASVPEFDNMFVERILSDMLEPMVINDESFESVVTDAAESFDSITTDAALRFDYMSEVDVQAEPLSGSNSHVSINLVSITNTSITIDLWFANNNSVNNSVGIWEPRTGQWRWLFGQGQPAGRSGRHTIPNLSPGVTYFLEALSWDGQRWHRQQIAVTTSAPPANIVFHQRSSVDFRLDRIFTDALGADLTNRFMDAANEGFYVLHHFIGGSSPGRMRIDHERNMPRYVEGWSGFPIRWQLFGVHNDWHLYSIDHAQRMRATNIETTEMPIHEIGHNFDNFRWSFEAEAMAVFFSYYYYATTGRRMANGHDNRTFQGGQFRTYMRNYAYRGMGQINHNEAMQRGVYSGYSMAYVLGTISGNIGWQPFTDTFNYFRALPHDEIPQTDLAKLNLFLTKLRDFSGRDVIAMIPANARNVYQQYFGGQIRYLARLTVSPSGTWQAPGEASSRTITVGSDTTWHVSSNQPWITISNIAPANQTGNGSFRINVSSNIDGLFGRSGIVTLTGGGTTRIIHVTQPRATTNLTVSQTEPLQVRAEASSQTINVTTNTTWNVSSNRSWLTISHIIPANRNGSGSFRINVDANTGGQRDGVITVSGGGITRTIIVIQDAVQDSFSIIPDGDWRVLSPDVAYQPVRVITRPITPWDVSVNANASSWLSVVDITPADHNGEGSFIMRADINDGQIPLEGAVTVTFGRARSEEGRRVINVWRWPREALLIVSPSDNWDAPSRGDTRNITVHAASGSWNARSTDPTWLTVYPPRGSSGSRFTITADSNPGGNRSARIIVNAGNHERYFWVHQATAATAIQCPPIALVSRGTAVQYLAMGIGWPLGNRTQPHSEDRTLNEISSRFGPRPPHELHLGIDIRDPAGAGHIMGAPIIAVADGTVINRTMSSSPDSQGYSISIRATCSTLRDPATGHPLIFTHHHMRYAPTLEANATVRRGQVLGFVGNSGAERTSSGHLHFEVANSNAVWGPGTTRASRITRRINPMFFYPAGSFQGLTEVWNEISTASRSLDSDYGLDLDTGDVYIGKFRPLFYDMPLPFAELVGRETFHNWLLSRSDEERENENVAVSFIRYFNISREDFTRANEELRQSWTDHGASPTDSSSFELYPIDLIFTFDNEKINRYFLWENSSAVVEFGLGMEIGNARPLFYNMPGPFAELVGREAFIAWKYSRSSVERANESIAVSFIRHFNINRADFTAANEETRYVWGRLQASAEQGAIFETYDVDMIFSFDNEKINEFFLWENSLNPEERELGQRQLTFPMVAAGSNHSVGLKEDRTVWTWGQNDQGQLGDGTTINRHTPVQVQNLTNVTAIAAGSSHNVGLRTDGTVWAWGANSGGQLGDNTRTDRHIPVQVQNLTNVTAIAAGGGHSVALREDGTVWAWGANVGDGATINRHTPVQVQNLTNVTAIAAGRAHSIALKEDGTIWAWGSNNFGQLGDSTIMHRNIPVQVQNMANVTAIAAGDSHSVGLKTDGTVWAWGMNWSGQLGDSTTMDRHTPVQIQNLTNIIAIATGSNHSIGLRENGTVWVWGANGQGQLGDGTIETRHTPVEIQNLNLTNITTITAGHAHSIALRDNGTVWTWGSNSRGQLGDSTVENRYTPVQVLEPDGQGILNLGSSLIPQFPPIDVIATPMVAIGWSHSIGLKEDGTVWAWGNNANGQLGDRTTTARHTPVQVQNLTNVIAIAVGQAYSIALREDGTVWAWGPNDQGQLGDGTTTQRTTPVQVQNLTNVIAITAGQRYSIALREDGTVWTWGNNANGQLGDGTTMNRHTPVQVQNLANITAIAAGDRHSVAIGEDGTVWAWGLNANGQLGDGTTTQRTTPVQVQNLTNATSIAAGESHSAALREDGTVWAWGVNGQGQLGDGTATFRRTPVQVQNLTNVISIAACSGHSIALQEDGAVWTWGWNGFGQLGDGGTANRHTPVQVQNFTNITAIAAGQLHSAALREDGTVWAWGRNDFGQLGDSTTINRHTPVQVLGSDGHGFLNLGSSSRHQLPPISEPTSIAFENEQYKADIPNEGYISISVTARVRDEEGNEIQRTITYSLGGVHEGVSIDSVTGIVTITSEAQPGTIVILAKYGELIATVNLLLTDNLDVLITTPMVAAGHSHNVGLSEDGTAWAWGWNDSGELGDGTGWNHHTPVQVQNLMNATIVAAGERHSIALREDGTVWAWGANWFGQLGDGTTTERHTLVQVQNLENVTAIAVGSNHSVALREDGTVWAWGASWNGQLGDGMGWGSRNTPVQVQNLENVIAVAAGGHHSIAIREDGTVWTWGANWNGQLGDGTTEDHHTPAQVQNLTNATAIAAGESHSIALKEDGTVWAWGMNDNGQLGDGTTTQRTTPVQVQNLENVITIAAGEEHSVVLKEDGTVWAWGFNWQGALGDGTTMERHTPVQVQNLENATAIAAGAFHSVALRDDGTVWTWGWNSQGQLGDGTVEDHHMPVQVLDSDGHGFLNLRNI